MIEKKIENLTKYYLCSDHFTSEDFIDPNVQDKSFLRLNRSYAFRNASNIPLPSIFEDNLMKNVKKVHQNPKKFVNYTKHATYQRSSKHHQSFHLSYKPNTIREHTDDAEDVATIGETQDLKTEDIKSEEMSTEFIEENLEEESYDTETLVIDLVCRLCANNSCDLYKIFDDQGQFYEDTECIRLMPAGLIEKDDGLPQLVCLACIEKLQSCAKVIDNFVLNQSLFSS